MNTSVHGSQQQQQQRMQQSSNSSILQALRQPSYSQNRHQQPLDSHSSMFNMSGVIPTLDRHEVIEINDDEDEEIVDYVDEVESDAEHNGVVMDHHLQGPESSSLLRQHLSNLQGNSMGAPSKKPPIPFDANRVHRDFWPNQKRKFENMTDSMVRGYCKHMELPMARVKKIMKIDDDVKMQMISQDAPLFLSAAAEMFIQELTIKSWMLVEEGRRKTLQKCDIAAAVSRHEHFDFLLDIVPREEIRKFAVSGDDGVAYIPTTSSNSSSDVSSPSVSTHNIDSSRIQGPHTVQYVLADCDGNGKNVFQLDNGQVLQATAIGQPIPISDPSGSIDLNQMQLPPGVRIVQMQQGPMR